MMDGSVFEDRTFLPNSSLLPYLEDKALYDVAPESHEHTTYEVMIALRRIISTESLFDPGNNSIIICNPELEKALDTKFLHVSQIERYINRHFVPLDSSPGTTSMFGRVTAVSSEFPGAQVGSLVRFEIPTVWNVLSNLRLTQP